MTFVTWVFGLSVIYVFSLNLYFLFKVRGGDFVLPRRSHGGPPTR